MENETLTLFLEEAQALLVDLKRLGASLRGVDIPNHAEYARLNELTNKLNRLIGGTASMGFSMFIPIARKASLLTARSSISREISIREVILNLNALISVCSMYYGSLRISRNLNCAWTMLKKELISV